MVTDNSTDPNNSSNSSSGDDTSDTSTSSSGSQSSTSSTQGSNHQAPPSYTDKSLTQPDESTKFSGDPYTKTPPDVPKHDSGGKADTKVSTPSIKTFSANIGKLVPEIDAARKYVDEMWKPRAGGFPSAILLANNVAKLQGETTVAMTKMMNTLIDLQHTMNGIASDYETTAEANKLTADKMKDKMKDVSSGITDIGATAEEK